ncbi:MAG: methylamine utilization protein [Verrucomicrobiota bacterium]|nr:methylamine utilization protein [Verrucomicrobiota bacterium]
MKRKIAVSIFTLGTLAAVRGGTLNVAITDTKGAPVADAVVYATSTSGGKSMAKRTGVIDQMNQQFVPYVSAVQVGTAVTFPNHDNIRHHVYSFSPAKKFELPLYAGVPAKPIVFDKEGIVTLGCNIHDWMLAYVVVLATPHFQVTQDDGHARLKNLPPGSYRVEVWQPRMKGSPENSAQTIDLSADKEMTLNLDLKPDWRSKKGPSLNPEDYR